MTVARLGEPALLTDQVFGAIRDAIMSGELAPGSRLRLRDLAAQLGTSPMPVREAIGRLEQSGLVVRSPHRGAVVADLTAAELGQIYDTRLLLEMEATRLSAAVVGPADLSRMRATHRRLIAAAAAGRASDALDHDEILLTIFYGAGGNAVLLGLIEDLWRRCRPYKLLGVRQGEERAGDSWATQGPLIEAAAEHDVAAAMAITRRSLEMASERIRRLLDSPSS